MLNLTKRNIMDGDLNSHLADWKGMRKKRADFGFL